MVKIEDVDIATTERVYTMKTAGRRLWAKAWVDDAKRGVTVSARSHVDLEQQECFTLINKLSKCQFLPSNVDGLRKCLGDLELSATCCLQWVIPSLWSFTGFEGLTGLKLPDFADRREQTLEYRVYFSFEPRLIVLNDTRMACKPDRRRKQQEINIQDDPDPVDLWNWWIRSTASIDSSVTGETVKLLTIDSKPDNLMVIRSTSGAFAC